MTRENCKNTYKWMEGKLERTRSSSSGSSPNPRFTLSFSISVIDMRLLSYLLLLLPAVGLASAAACPTTLPTWTVKSLKTESGTGLGAGKATFDFMDNATNKTETLSCTLRNGYRCEITPANTEMLLSLQIQIDILYFTMKTGMTCDTDGK